MKRYVFDYSKLRGRIIEKFGTISTFAKETSYSRANFSSKITGRTYFSQRDILKISRALDILPEEIATYFFTQKVQQLEQEGGQ